jgi:Tol biopolymer transport system component/DNA-binding winged helix-turn-helix (wHTH) protein
MAMSKAKLLVYEFENFRLDVAERRLFRDGEPVTLSSKAFDLLLVLVENSGRLVEKEELYQRIWADQIVEESNLTVQMSAIRKALGETRRRQQYINTVTGRGYRFVANVTSLIEDNDVVIETQTLSRIVIETEAEDNNDGNNKAAPRFFRRPAEQALLLADDSPNNRDGTGSVSATANPLSTETAVRQRRIVVLVAGVLAVVLVAFGAAWLFQSRNRSKTSASSPAMILRRFTTHGGVPFRVAISPNGKNLVYWQRINKKESLWLGDIETNTSVLLNEQQGLRFDNLVFALDGSSIYFNVRSPNRPQTMLGRMSVLGGAITELLPGVVGPVTFGPEGKQMAFLQRDGAAKLTSIIIADSSDGQNQRKLISLRQYEGFASESLSWSPDGKNIAFASYDGAGQEQLMSVSVADATVSRVSDGVWSDVSRVAWLPDSSGLLVVARENVGERMRQIWFVSARSGEARRITNGLNVFMLSSLTVSSDGKLAVLQGHVNSEIWIAPHGDVKQAHRVLQGVAPRYEGIDGLAWTSDGRLLYTAYVGDSEAIWSINNDGTDLKQLTPTKSNSSDNNMCATADGRYVVFQSNRSRSIEIWRVNADGSDMKQLTSGGNNSHPTLSPDGKSVIYTATRDGKVTLMRIPIDGGEPTEISDTPSSFSQVSPDGQYIACIVPSSKRLLVISFEGGQTVKTFPLTESALQGVRMRWTPDAKAILYRDDPEGLWRQALNEATPQRVKEFEESTLRQFAWSFDGKTLAYTSGAAMQEIILIENFK